MNEVKFKANLKDFDDLKNEVNRMYPTDTASGAVASFSDGAEGVPVESLIVNIEPVQAGSGDPSPENIRPISGHEEVTVTRTDGNGDNLFTITIPLGDTIYGGVLDVGKGELTVDRTMVDFPSTAWTRQDELTNTMRYSFSISNMLDVGGVNAGDVMCSDYPTADNASDTPHVMHRGRSVHVFVDKQEYPTVTAWQNYLSTASIQLVYPLATPITVSLTPQQVTTLYGTNDIFADTGNTSVTYKADIELYIQKKISAAVKTQSKDVNTAKLTDGEALHTAEDENIKPVEQTEDEIIEPIEQPEETA